MSPSAQFLRSLSVSKFHCVPQTAAICADPQKLAIARIDAIIIKPYQASKPLYQTSKL
jgi:hypothetical protein